MENTKVEKRDIVANLLLSGRKAIIESELKEKFLWNKHLKELENGNKEEANKIKMQFAAQKRDRQDSFEPWVEMLEKELLD
jgi:hypothetical protein